MGQKCTTFSNCYFGICPLPSKTKTKTQGQSQQGTHPHLLKGGNTLRFGEVGGDRKAFMFYFKM